MGDAEIIPLGTRGRPGRGTGRDKPSTSSRSLAGAAPGDASARPDHPSPDPAGRPELPGGDQPADLATDASPPAERPPDVAGHTPGSVGRPAPDVGAGGDGGARVTGEAGRPGVESTGSGWLRDVAGHICDEGPVRDSVKEPPPEASAPPRRALPSLPLGEVVAAIRGAAREVFGDDWERRTAEVLAFVRRRLTGEYVVDEYGLDPEVTDRFLSAVLRPLAEKWFRVEVRGLDNLPAVGGALVVSNHSGTLPLDGMVTTYVIRKHTGRHLRPLGADLVFRLPYVGELARKAGATLACMEDAERMLSGGELVGVWPEGFKGIGKPYSERYKLQRFGRGGFVAAAVATGVPIVPVSVVGAEEIYPLVGNVPVLARLLGLPYVPITPFFPWLGLLGMVPLPSKWVIEFGEPIRTDSYDAQAADDPMLMFDITDQVREAIQQNLYALLMQRRSVFR